jgi:hypothetical protein
VVHPRGQLVSRIKPTRSGSFGMTTDNVGLLIAKILFAGL